MFEKNQFPTAAFILNKFRSFFFLTKLWKQKYFFRFSLKTNQQVSRFFGCEATLSFPFCLPSQTQLHFSLLPPFSICLHHLPSLFTDHLFSGSLLFHLLCPFVFFPLSLYLFLFFDARNFFSTRKEFPSFSSLN